MRKDIYVWNWDCEAGWCSDRTPVARHILGLPDTVVERWAYGSNENQTDLFGLSSYCFNSLQTLFPFITCACGILIPLLCPWCATPCRYKDIFYTLSSLLWPQITILQREKEEEIDFLVQKFLQRPRRLKISNSWRSCILSILLRGKSFNGSKTATLFSRR